MNKRNFLQYLALNGIALSSIHGLAQAAPASASASTPALAPKSPIHHTLVGIDSEGKPLSLSNFAGKTCLVTFFTADCSLCTKELKLMREFYIGNHKRNFTLIGVNLDEKQSDYTEYMKLVALSVPANARFPIIWRNAAGHSDSFGPINRKPTHFMLDKAHNQVLKREGSFMPNDWDNLWTMLS